MPVTSGGPKFQYEHPAFNTVREKMKEKEYKLDNRIIRQLMEKDSIKTGKLLERFGLRMSTYEYRTTKVEG